MTAVHGYANWYTNKFYSLWLLFDLLQIKEAVDEDFQCTDSGINGLKVKLNAYGSFKNTAMGLKKYKSGTTKCSVAS